MSDISKGDFFVDGQTVNGARLNNLVDQAVIQPSFVSDKSLVAPLAGDVALIYQQSSGQLRKASMPVGVQGTVTSVGLALPGSIFNVTGSPINTVGTLTGTLLNQVGNKFLGSPSDGSSGPPAFRALGPSDMPSGMSVIGGTVVDWDLAPMFFLTITGNITLTFTNNISGRAIKIRTFRPSGAFTVTWPAAIWAGGVIPPISNVNLFEFNMMGASLLANGDSYS